MSLRWGAVLMLALGAPSGYTGSAASDFGIRIGLHMPPDQQRQAPVSGPSPTAGTSVPSDLITCSGATSAVGDAALLRVICSTPTFMQVTGSDVAGRPIDAGQPPGEPCDGFRGLAGLTCVAGVNGPAQSALEGVSLMPAASALQADGDTAARPYEGQVFELRRRDKLTTLTAIRVVEPESGSVSLLVTF